MTNKFITGFLNSDVAPTHNSMLGKNIVATLPIDPTEFLEDLLEKISDQNQTIARLVASLPAEYVFNNTDAVKNSAISGRDVMAMIGYLSQLLVEFMLYMDMVADWKLPMPSNGAETKDVTADSDGARSVWSKLQKKPKRKAIVVEGECEVTSLWEIFREIGGDDLADWIEFADANYKEGGDIDALWDEFRSNN